MPITSTGAVLYIFLLLSKHFFADWLIQSDRIAAEKGKNLGILAWHGSHHAFGTFFATLPFAPVSLALTIATLDFLLHCIIDYTKASPYLGGKLNLSDHYNFTLIGLDQLAHQLCYLLYTLIIFSISS